MKVCLNVKDAPFVGSGYGKIASYLITHLKEKFDLVVQAPIGLIGLVFYDGVPVYGRYDDDRGEDVAKTIFDRENCDVYVTLADVWWYRRIHELSEKGELVWVPIATIDYEEIPGFVLERLSKAFAVIPPYRKAYELLKSLDNVLEPAYYCGVDTKVYRPLGDEKEEIFEKYSKTRYSLFRGADFGITVVAVNQTFRKNWETVFRVVKMVAEDNPDLRITLYAHTLAAVPTEYDLRLLAESVGFTNVVFADPVKYWYGYEESELSRIYNASDLVLSLTAGESGNLPAVEAQACGTPVVATDYTINKEIIADERLLVPVKYYFYTPNPCLKKALPDEEKAVDVINEIINSDPSKWMRKCRNFAERFDWKIIADVLADRLEEVGIMLEEGCLKPPKADLPWKEVILT